MYRRHSCDRWRFTSQCLDIFHSKVLAMNLLWTGWSPKTRVELGNKNCVGAQLFDLIGKCFVKSLDDRHHKYDREDTDADTENGQRRTQLVSAQCIKRHVSGFFDVV